MGWDLLQRDEDGSFSGYGPDVNLHDLLRIPNRDRIFAVYEALTRGDSQAIVCQLTGYDPWFVNQIAEIVEHEHSLHDLDIEYGHARPSDSDSAIAIWHGLSTHHGHLAGTASLAQSTVSRKSPSANSACRTACCQRIIRWIHARPSSKLIRPIFTVHTRVIARRCRPERKKDYHSGWWSQSHRPGHRV